MPSLPPPILVASKEALQKALGALNDAPIVGVDTESNSLHAYREQVCLMQFSTAQADYLVDPLAVDVAPLGELFADPQIEKVFHAAEYDLLTLKRDFGFAFDNLFDTMVAARILGYEKVGLGNVLEDFFGVELEKKYQRANWGKRPLSREMLAYARLDTHYLIALRDRFQAELIEKGRWPIAEEDFARLAQVDGGAPGPVGADIWRIRGAFDLNQRGAAVLQELANYRDELAQARDVPPFKVLGDKLLFSIAEAVPRSKAELEAVGGMSAKLMQRHGSKLLAAVGRGTEAQAPKRPPKPEYNGEYVDRYEALRAWRKEAAQRKGVESDVVLPRDLLEQIAKENPKSSEKLAAILRAVPWRLAAYGKQIEKVLGQH
jgi:ribonuclease D